MLHRWRAKYRALDVWSYTHPLGWSVVSGATYATGWILGSLALGRSFWTTAGVWIAAFVPWWALTYRRTCRRRERQLLPQQLF
jgi:hypothetical protein